ncbi:hypothetical protein BCR34DRAFT_617861 [Clohesyomyces aquaticus]|uniref:Uncharacterized protein n=1 Tax=Clohesyomyces aquaticus TaxID=1231657 RepID=A0A1Y1YYL6_9PLEO|nr:hypothetical protein BCR34DRAFT_617861 [Clohesyomyces aquaticus]
MTFATMPIFFFIFLFICVVHKCAGQADEPSDFNVGFDLKFGYGIVAISYSNGSVAGTAKVESNEEYRNAFRGMSRQDNWHYTPVYYRQLKRRARKALGLPASKDVAAISTLVRDLKAAAEEKIRFNITSAAASIPRIPAVFGEDLSDSFEYVGIDYLQIMGPQSHIPLLTYESTAALAGHGLAVCPNITNMDQCSNDSLQENYYVVDYTRHSLFTYLTNAQNVYYATETVFFDLDLGSDARNKNPREEYYW